MNIRCLVAFFCLTAVSFLPNRVVAQDEGSEAYGPHADDVKAIESPTDVDLIDDTAVAELNATDEEATTWIPASAFVPRSSTTTWEYAGTGYISKASGSALFWAPVNIPNGALITSIELQYCDDAAAGNLRFWLTYFDGSVGYSDVDDAETSGAPGCAFLPLSGAALNHTFDIGESSNNRQYVINVRFGTDDITNRIRGVKLRWRRQAESQLLDIDANNKFDALTDGLLIIRYAFGFTGEPLTAVAVDEANCQRCTDAEIQAYLDYVTSL